MVFDKRVTLLDLTEEDGAYRWTEGRKLWAAAELTGKTNLFSRVGIGARGVVFTLHPTRLSLDQAVRWNGRHCFLTSVIREGPVSVTVEAALVDPVVCTASLIPDDDADEILTSIAGSETKYITFPAVLTGKYLGFSQEAPMAQVQQTFVLVTPKPVRLEEGDLVAAGGMGVFAVRVCHRLDPHKNEYEVHRKGDA